MKETIAPCLGLQRHHDAVRRCEGHLADIARQVKDVEAHNQARTKKIEQLALSLKRVLADTAAAENELRTCDAALVKLRQRFDTVASTREAAALEREIDQAEEKKTADRNHGSGMYGEG